MKVFARLFKKAAGSKGSALGRLRRGENILGVSSLPSFLLCARGAKEESG